MQLRCKSIFAQKSSRSTSFRAQQNFDDDDGWKGETAFQQSAAFISAHTHWVKIRKNWKICVKIHTGLNYYIVQSVSRIYSLFWAFRGN